MMKPLFKVFYTALVLLLCSCSVEKIPSEKNAAIEVYFCPQDNCSNVLERNILSAKDTIHCAFYDLDLKNVISALSSKSKEIDVKIVHDESTYSGQIKGKGYRLDDSSQLMHNKFCVIDNEIVTTGSMNPTSNDNSVNNNNFLVFHSKYLAENYMAEFEELWKGNFGEGSKNIHDKMALNGIDIENYFCPEDGCSNKAVSLIKNSKKTIYFMTFSFTDSKVSDALIFKKNIEIKGVIDKSQAAGQYSIFNDLKNANIDVITDKSKGKMHHKVFIIDNETVLTGSYNPTSSGNGRNDENIVIIHNQKIALKFADEFFSIYSIK